MISYRNSKIQIEVKLLTIDDLKTTVMGIVRDYPVKRVLLFGSRASETNRVDSDVDLIVEFFKPVSLLTLSDMRIRLSEELKLDVDLIHGPVQEDDLLDIDKVVELYAA